MQKEALLKLAIQEENTLYHIARSLLSSNEDCQDAVQEALMKAVPNAFRIRNEEYAKTWLIRIVINCCRDMQRAALRHPKVSLSNEMADLLPSESPCDREFRMILDDMEEKLKLPLILHYLEGYSVKDISKILKIPEGTVKRRLWNARKALREELMKEAL